MSTLEKIQKAKESGYEVELRFDTWLPRKGFIVEIHDQKITFFRRGEHKKIKISNIVEVRMVVEVCGYPVTVAMSP